MTSSKPKETCGGQGPFFTFTEHKVDRPNYLIFSSLLSPAVPVGTKGTFSFKPAWCRARPTMDGNQPCSTIAQATMLCCSLETSVAPGEESGNVGGTVHPAYNAALSSSKLAGPLAPQLLAI